MKAFVHPADLSSREAISSIQSTFALVGYARYLKVLELLAGADNQIVTMDWSGWAAALFAEHEAVVEFLMFCHQCHALEIIEDDGEAVTVTCPDLQVHSPAPEAVEAPTPRDDTLFTDPEQWAKWFIADLSCPPKIANSADYRRMFARWCASRVTVGDMAAAVDRAIAQGTGLGLSELHGHLSALRAQRLKEANECF